MKKLFFFALAVFSGSASAAVTSLSEVVLLPPYCRGTQLIRDISKDPKPLEEYYAMYGMSYSHFHHYCWALNSENNAWKTRDNSLRQNLLGYALGDLQYSLDRSDPNFVFLPEMYNTKARLLFTVRRDAEAVIALRKAIQIRPDFVTAIARLSDYYAKHGDHARAIKTLEEGIDNTERAGTLIKKLKKLGKTYAGIPGNARNKETANIEPVAPVVSDKNPDLKNPDPALSNADAPAVPKDTASPAVPPLSQDGKPANNPYCRFCP